MTAILSPLPLPFPASAMQSEERGRRLAVGELPISDGDHSLRRPPLSLPMLETRQDTHPPEPEKPRRPSPTPLPSEPGDFTDADLTEALLPLMGGAGTGAGVDFHDDAAFEAVLRATFRRALSEHQNGPFQQPGWRHRTMWHLQALFSSRAYDEVLAEKIRRFHVEEVYLLDRDRLSLVSYASADPVRHANARKVGPFSRQLALRLRDESGALQLGFELGEGRRTFVRAGRFCYMVAVVHGEINDLVKADLDFALRRIETRYRAPFVQGHPLLKELQPLLEECLLIHSPAAPSGT